MTKTVGAFELLEPFRVSGGGNCRWTKAAKGDQVFHLKEFLSPKFPTAGSEKVRQKKQAECESFNSHHSRLLKEVRKAAGEGGKLVVPVAFFRHDSAFYQAAPFIEAHAASETEISRLSHDDIMLILTTVTSGVNALHTSGVVHGDLKPANILLSRSTRGRLNAHVIDFDSSYVTAEPPEAALLTNDAPYLSPETFRYIKGDAPGASLTTKADVFSLGLVFHRYATGEMPTWPAAHTYAAECITGGDHLQLSSRVTGDLRELLEKMLLPEPGDRPSVSQIHTRLKALRSARPGSSPLPEPPKRLTEGGSRVRRGGTSSASTAEPATDAAVPIPTATPDHGGARGPSRVRRGGRPST